MDLEHNAAPPEAVDPQDLTARTLPRKKAYVPPRLIEYGDIVTLTRGTGVYHCDAAHMKRTRPPAQLCT